MLQLRSFMIWGLFLITLSYINVVDAVPERNGLHQRDDISSSLSNSVATNSAEETSSATPKSGSTATATMSAVSSITSGSASATLSISSMASHISASTVISSLVASTTSASRSTETGLFNSTLTPNLLPITPTITPAFSVAGVLLMISGIIYAFIGIKIRRLHIFLSASYLTSLSITVLILYVMSVPVSNAIEGAYLIAIVVPGLVVGGGAIIFPEMTEGVGCILGGFCFAMWLLVLTRGGLITSTGGICAMIAAFCIATLATSFHHVLRPYGLIASLSFGGATAIVLGIDCFSRAGLKEFWAWIWHLNDNLFAFGATTYPITRGMRAEIAAIFVLFLAGVASQVKLWTVIARKKADTDAKKRQDEENREREEDVIARQLAERTERLRNQWEAVYGNGEKVQRSQPPRSIADSGVGDMMDSPKKTSRSTVTSIHRQSTGEEMEMTSMGIMTGSKSSMELDGQDSGVAVRIAHDDRADIETIPEIENDDQLDHSCAAKYITCASQPNAEGSTGRAESDTIPNESELKDVHDKSFVPKIVPSHIQVPNIRDSTSDDVSSRATNNEDDFPQKAQRSSKRFSTSNPLKRLSRTAIRNSQRLSGMSLDGNSGWLKMRNSNNLEIPDYDRRSSVAATLDGISDKDDLESLPADMTAVSPLLGKFQSSPVESSPSEEAKKPRPVSTSLIELQRTSFGLEKSSAKEENKSRARSLSLTETVATTMLESSVEEVIPKQKNTQSAPLTEETLPSTPSKVVSSFRTNEWAKHLNYAEVPQVEELNFGHRKNHVCDSENQEDGEGEEENIDNEIPAPLDIRALQQTATNATPPPAPRLRSRENSSSSTRDRSLPRGSSSTSPRQSGPPQAHNQLGKQRSSPHMQRSASALSMNVDLGHLGRGRSTSSPMVPLYAHNLSNSTSAPNLLSQRQSLMKQKHSFMSLTPLASTPELEAVNNGESPQPGTPELSAGDSASNYARSFHSQDRGNDESYQRERGSLDNMSLRERQALIQQEREREELVKGTSSPFGVESCQQQNRSSISQNRNRQSSAPENPAQRDAMMASWRASVQEDLRGISRNNPVSANGYGNGYGMGGNNPSGQAQPSGRISAMQEREIDIRRQQLFEENRRKGVMNAMRKEEESRRSAQRGAILRAGALDGASGVENAHREVMRRMQRKASQNM